MGCRGRLRVPGKGQGLLEGKDLLSCDVLGLQHLGGHTGLGHSTPSCILLLFYFSFNLVISCGPEARLEQSRSV